MDILILGSTSNICAIRVFDNLNNLHHKINSIYCYDMINYNNNAFLHYMKNNVKIKQPSKIFNKIEYLYGLFNIDNYEYIIKPLIHKKLIIYVAVPPFCYKDITLFFYKYKYFYHSLILEKPLSLDYINYKTLQPYLLNNTHVMDHFLYKKDIQTIIKKYKDTDINFFKISFLYHCDVEDRLRYFDNVGFFIDMFQSHYLSILYSIINHKIYNLINATVVKNIKKQYHNYGGKNKVDTYFYLELNYDNNIYIFEGGKSMRKEAKTITINNEIFHINNYNNEYELFFHDLMESNSVNLISQHDIFWKITDNINKHFKTNNLKLSFYYKNKL